MSVISLITRGKFGPRPDPPGESCNVNSSVEGMGYGAGILASVGLNLILLSQRLDLDLGQSY